MSKYYCLLISGLSGSGKTTLGREFCKRCSGWTFIDGDSFYLDVKPKVTLSDGTIVTNWDSEDSIDWNKLNEVVMGALSRSNVVLVTFLPLAERFRFNVDCSVRLETGNNYIQKCIDARRKSKKFTTTEKKLLDEKMVREVVIPTYKSTLEQHVDFILDVYEGESRIPINTLIAILVLNLENYVEI